MKNIVKSRVLSGMRPTGRLHIGNLEGALKNWIRLQKEGSYDCFFFVADYHALTTEYDKVHEIQKNTKDMLIDWIAAGLDPKESMIYLQSNISEVALLHLYFSMITSVAQLERNPTYKEIIKETRMKTPSYGFLGYPVLQAADILIVRGKYIPVGKDQLPHIELTRDIARNFNRLYGETFDIPEPLLSEFPTVPGIDGRKMSKSYGNHILISDTDEAIKSKVMNAYTDPEKIKATDKGHPDGCVVWAYHGLYNQNEVDGIKKECEMGKIGCVACKNNLISKMLPLFSPIRERRREIESNYDFIDEMLQENSKKVSKIAKEVIENVREKVGI
jgi:tryptophanyl-tRNA synthetase